MYPDARNLQQQQQQQGGYPCDDEVAATQNRAVVGNSSSSNNNTAAAVRSAPSLGIRATSVLEQMEQNYQSGLLRKLAVRKSSHTPSSPTVSVVLLSSSPSLPSAPPLVSAPTTPTKEKKTSALAGEDKEKKNDEQTSMLSSLKSLSQQELLFLAAQEKHPTHRLLKHFKNQDKNKLNLNLNITASANITKEEALKMTVQTLSRQLDQVSNERNELKHVVKDLQHQLAHQTAKVQALECHFSKMNEAAILTSKVMTTTCYNDSDKQQQQQQHRRVGSPGSSVSETADMSDCYSDSFSGNSSSCCSFDCNDDNQSLPYEQNHQQQQLQQHQAQQKLQQYNQVIEEIRAGVVQPPPPIERLSVSFQRTGAKVRRARVQADEKRSQLTLI